MPRETDRWTEGQRNGQTLFYRTLPATPGHPKSLPKKKRCSKEETDALWESDIKTVLGEHVLYIRKCTFC